MRTNRPASTNPRQAQMEGKTIVLTFPTDAKLIYEVKSTSGRAWNRSARAWTVPLTVMNAEWAESRLFKLTGGLAEWLAEHRKPITVDLPPALAKLLFPFQQEGVALQDAFEGRFLNADDMGLGKTRQGLGLLSLRASKMLPAVVVCPKSVKGHWRNEAKVFFPKAKITVLSGGAEKAGRPPDADIIITNYDILHRTTPCPACLGKKKVLRDGEQVKCKACSGTGKEVHLRRDLSRVPYQTVYFDEAHYLQDPNSARTRAARLLTEDIPYVGGFTGTPMRNRPKDFFTVLNIIRPDLFPSWWKYAQRYCGAHRGRFGWNFNGSTHEEELHSLLKHNLMIRREKTEVLKDLPPLIRTVIPIELNDPAAYSHTERQWLRKIKALKKAGTARGSEALEMMEQLKQECVRQKLPGCIDWIRDFLESGEKLIVFCEHQFVVKALEKSFPGITATIDGGTSQAKRQKAIEDFQKNPRCRLFIGTKAAKEGVTLTAASNVATLELWWVPGDHDQADGRHHRIGQRAEKVTAWYLLAEDTIEETIAKMLDEKRKIISQVVAGRDPDTRVNLWELLDAYEKERAA